MTGLFRDLAGQRGRRGASHVARQPVHHRGDVSLMGPASRRHSTLLTDHDSSPPFGRAQDRLSNVERRGSEAGAFEMAASLPAAARESKHPALTALVKRGRH
jgi:hypothetical protein